MHPQREGLYYIKNSKACFLRYLFYFLFEWWNLHLNFLVARPSFNFRKVSLTLPFKNNTAKCLQEWLVKIKKSSLTKVSSASSFSWHFLFSYLVFSSRKFSSSDQPWPYVFTDLIIILIYYYWQVILWVNIEIVTINCINQKHSFLRELLWHISVYESMM